MHEAGLQQMAQIELAVRRVLFSGNFVARKDAVAVIEVNRHDSLLRGYGDVFAQAGVCVMGPDDNFPLLLVAKEHAPPQLHTGENGGSARVPDTVHLPELSRVKAVQAYKRAADKAQEPMGDGNGGLCMRSAPDNYGEELAVGELSRSEAEKALPRALFVECPIPFHIRYKPARHPLVRFILLFFTFL
jgi:hypothetical protein